MRHLSEQLSRRYFGRRTGTLALGIAAVVAVAHSPIPSLAAGILPPSPNPVGPHADAGGLNLVGGGVWIVRPVEQSAKAADKIALATVTAVGPARWSTPDGQRPTGATPQNVLSLQAEIYTPITVQVSRGFKHATAGDTLTFAVPGGKVGPDLYTVRTEPQYQLGEALLILLDAPAALPGSKRTAAMVRDVFRVTPQGRAVALHYRGDFDLQDTIARINVADGA